MPLPIPQAEVKAQSFSSQHQFFSLRGEFHFVFISLPIFVSASHFYYILLQTPPPTLRVSSAVSHYLSDVCQSVPPKTNWMHDLLLRKNYDWWLDVDLFSFQWDSLHLHTGEHTFAYAITERPWRQQHTACWPVSHEPITIRVLWEYESMKSQSE